MSGFLPINVGTINNIATNRVHSLAHNPPRTENIVMSKGMNVQVGVKRKKLIAEQSKKAAFLPRFKLMYRGARMNSTNASTRSKLWDVIAHSFPLYPKTRYGRFFTAQIIK
jgi:hypothetical protein